jgi:hypothetical protein
MSRKIVTQTALGTAQTSVARNGQGSFYNVNIGATDFGTWKDDKLIARG